MSKRIVVLVLIFVGLFGDIAPGIHPFIPVADAAVVTIDALVAVNGTSHLQAGSQTVFINDQTGYKFYRDTAGYCVYKKTTDGGTSWGATTTVDSQVDCVQIQVWYDKWTPGSASSSIHIATLDTGSSDIWYNRLDPASGDALLMGSSPVSMTTGQGGSISEGANSISITRGTDSTLYAVSNDGTGANDSYIVECTVNCNLAASWTETGVNPLDVASDYNLLMPLASGNIMLINRDISLEDIRSKIWNNTSWSGAWTTIDANATDNTTYDVGLAAAVSSSTPGLVYLAYTGDNATLGTDDSVRTAYYNGSTWATTTSVLSSGGATRAITGVAIALDAADDDVYVAYSARTTAATAGTGNVYWKTATSSMKNWSAEQGPVNASANDIYGVDLNSESDQRVYVSWFANTVDDILGDTIADIYPGVHASSTGIQTSPLYASTTAAYVGGDFLLFDTYNSHDITGITVTESGTIDALADIDNVKLRYDLDTTYPYICDDQSYSVSDTQFGSTDADGFSAANGTAAFTGSTVTISSTTVMCAYVELDVRDTAPSLSTIEISINDPSTDITATNWVVQSTAAVSIASTTNVLNDVPTQSRFHFRNDDGSETTATSKTGGVENSPLNALNQSSSTRLRIEVSNEGSSSTPAIPYRLEYAQTAGACSAVSSWTDVGAVGGDFDMFNSANLTDGANTTNIAVGVGGVTDDNPGFLVSNGGVKDTSSQTTGVIATSTQFIELEYSIVASTTAATGNRYCFRVSNAGMALHTYSVYPTITINPDVVVATTSTAQTTATTTPATNFYVGAPFIVIENLGSRNVTSITIGETGTVDAQNDLDNIKLRYDLDTTAPYDCAAETYIGTEPQFGATDADGFSAPNGTSTFTGSVGISTTQTLCVYPIVDVLDTTTHGQTLNIILPNPSINVLVSGGGFVSPTTTLDLIGSTTIQGPILTQTHYHWRNDDGTETGATSATFGAEDTPVSNVSVPTPIRLRTQISNEGLATSSSRTYTLEYATKITTCSAVVSWTDVGEVGGDWDMHNSPNISDGNNTTNILPTSGGVSDENITFKSPNAALKDTSSTVASLTLGPTQYLEAEFAIKQTTSAAYNTTYCFRLVVNTAPAVTYTVYPELTTSPERDFEIQRGTITLSGTSATLTAGAEYVAPASSTRSFMRITNAHHTGAGNSSGGVQNADDVTAYIQNPSNLLTSVTIARPPTATGDTRVSWEIVEFIGEPNSDNEFVVRSQSVVTYGATDIAATGTTVTGVSDDSDVVVFITGQLNPDTGTTNFNTGQSTSAWSSSSDAPIFTRGEAGGNASIVSYAVVEFSGPNWIIQRSEHAYTATGTTETEAIAAVNSLSRTFIHTQKRSGLNVEGTDEFGHEVWLSSIGYVSYYLEADASSASDHTSVAWVIENTQTSSGAMDITRSNGTLVRDNPPNTLAASIPIGTTLNDFTNASLFVMTRSASSATPYPDPIAAARIASTTHYELWRSWTATNVAYRTEIVEWPTAGLAIKQNYYRFYVDNNALLPTDPWPAGVVDLGENTAIAPGDEPVASGERVRLRMSIKAVNATFPATSRTFRLQFGARSTTCSAITESSWFTLGSSASSSIWRGYNAGGVTDGTALSGDPVTPGDLVLSISDVAGTLEEENDAAVNPYAVPEGDDVEYDWIIENNGANSNTYYCFRVVESDGTRLNAYLQYPQLKTADFTPKTQNWRWYDDETNVTPTSALGAGENSAPANIANGQGLKLRVTVKETKNVASDDARFKLQYSEYPNFSTVANVASTSLCTASSTWCYANGGGSDNAVIPTKLLTDADSCSGGVGDGCGTHNESPNYLTGYRHENGAAAEYEFTIQSAGPRVNRVYYFRLFDIARGAPVSVNTGESYPSLSTEGGSVEFTMTTLPASTVVEGVTLDVTATPTSVPFGSMPLNTSIEAAHRLTVDTNGTEGYQLFMAMTGDLANYNGATIDPITGTNQSPVSWDSGCAGGAVSCFGYHTSDDTLQDGSTRFSAVDTYARFSTTTVEEISYSSQPIVNEDTDIVFRVLVRSLQDAGDYETVIRYILVPVY